MIQIKSLDGRVLHEVNAASLVGANLSYANLSGADLSHADLSYADLSHADLRSANLSYAKLIGADLIGADLSGADLSGADPSGANLRSANLSGATGLPDMCEWFRANFRRHKRGVVAYKTFGSEYGPNKQWIIAPGSIITENCNPNPGDNCGCGINVATLGWVRKNYPDGTIWKCLIPWAALPGVVIPWGTDGKVRCSKLVLLREVRDDER